MEMDKAKTIEPGDKVRLIAENFVTKVVWVGTEFGKTRYVLQGRPLTRFGESSIELMEKAKCNGSQCVTKMITQDGFM